MINLMLDLDGKDAVFISNVYRYHSGLSTLGLYRNHPEILPSTELVKEKIDYLQLTYEGGATGNHAQIAARKRARKEVTEMFKKILFYLRSVATEDDIPALIQAGFEVKHVAVRKRSVVIPA